MTCSRQSLGTTILVYAELQGGCRELHSDVTLRPAADVEEDDVIDGLMEAQTDYHPAAKSRAGAPGAWALPRPPDTSARFLRPCRVTAGPLPGTRICRNWAVPATTLPG